ncbi:hypothetical protein LTR91_021539 [Friedmanniomyces endolithicus]|uniref:UspA domain-containing protein n=1 Tax=Friedmanniomyces endolithicus TaxID=329885 RepID=A0AAN6H6M7_9PEZI|nr:hypothetical protein LTR94_018343 [Friedmanniomyces endolithicus]KAK0772728.1 hypothetical protein LTR38_016805 [Friedmanniomyces endolithicus]KAK0773441.1 hypothetical protein LTR59_015266 [Friedmanniomyces endolithicus]KAK0779847.1 hypothetical protein LTR75_015233 [Friedmanniomyces endolithicus]KAK0890349.1 hypothetical protein LTR02_014752 [Friedmanniomyces endolithicus]
MDVTRGDRPLAHDDPHAKPRQDELTNGVTSLTFVSFVVHHPPYPPTPKGMSATPSPRSSALRSSSTPRSDLLPDRSIPEQPLDPSTSTFKPSFIPAWRRPTLAAANAENGGRRPSVQFVPHAKETTGGGSRSSSAKPISSHKLSSVSPNTPSAAGGRRMSSPPPPAQFQKGVSFDTFSNPAASDFSLTLNRKHRDYEYTKRSRTFLCGTDTNEYSDTALIWLLDELVDDGDEIVCLRVEKDSREAVRWAGGQGEKGYRAEAERFLEAIEKKNNDDRAISLVLEFSIGKVQEAIQQMIRIYEPAILVVGTKGRSLTGYGALLSSGSVSKYCLQYSPVPVIVVRPSKKRARRKEKREKDPGRKGYRDILDKSDDAPRGRGGHLLDDRNRSSIAGLDLGLLGDLDTRDPDEEARKVAEAIGYRPSRPSTSDTANITDTRATSLSRVTSTQSNTSGRSVDDLNSPHPTERVLQSPDLRNLDSPVPSDDEADEDDAEDPDPGRLQESIRPEDEAAMLAYERAQKVMEEEREEEEARVEREKTRSASRAGGRSRSRGGMGNVRKQDEGGTGGAVLGLLAQLDRGLK